MISGVADGGGLDRHLAREDQRLQPRARQFRQARRQHAVEPGRALVAGDGDFKPLTVVRSRSKEAPCSEEEFCMTETVAPEPTPEQAALFARVRRMMLIAGLTTALAVAAVLIAIGYRLFRSEGSVGRATDITATPAEGRPHRLHRRRRRPPGGDAGCGRDHRNPHLRCADAETGRPAEIRQRTLNPIRKPAQARFGAASGPLNRSRLSCSKPISRLLAEANAPFV